LLKYLHIFHIPIPTTSAKPKNPRHLRVESIRWMATMAWWVSFRFRGQIQPAHAHPHSLHAGSAVGNSVG